MKRPVRPRRDAKRTSARRGPIRPPISGRGPSVVLACVLAVTMGSAVGLAACTSTPQPSASPGSSRQGPTGEPASTGGRSAVDGATAAPNPTPIAPASPPSTRSPIATPAASPAPIAPAPVTIAAVGDVMLGNTPRLPPDPAGYLDLVKSALDDAQIQFGNLEGTLTTATRSKCQTVGPPCNAYRVPPGYAAYLATDGFDVLNAANNHSRDFGIASQHQTTAVLKAAGILEEGLPGQIAVYDTGAAKVAFVGFAPYARTANLLDLAAAGSLIRSAAAAADVVVVYMHAGAEGADRAHVPLGEEYFVGEDRGNVAAFAHMAIDNGADLVIASGPHTLRGMEFYRRRLIAYSLGDFASYHNFDVRGTLALSAILRVTLGADGTFGSGRLVAVRLDANGRPHLDPSGGSIGLVARLSRADFPRTGAVVDPDGVIEPPPPPAEP